MGLHFAEGITVEKKADATYKVVGAGANVSICYTVMCVDYLFLLYS